jgi:hypothetical protein
MRFFQKLRHRHPHDHVFAIDAASVMLLKSLTRKQALAVAKSAKEIE